MARPRGRRTTPMFNLFEMMQQAQNGAAIDTVAQQFGLTPRQAENAVDVLLPAFTLALQRQMQSPQALSLLQGWPALLTAMQPAAPPTVPQAMEAAGRAFAHDSMRQGSEVMKSLFGTSDLSTQVAAQAAAASGLPATILQQMMPAMGAMLASGMLKTFSQEGLAGVITAMQRGLPAAAPATAEAAPPSSLAGAGLNPFAAYLAMASAMMGGTAAGDRPEPEPPAPVAEPDPAPGATPLPNPFNAGEMGAYFNQMLAAAAGQAAAMTGVAPVAVDGADGAAASPAPDDEPAASADEGPGADAPPAPGEAGDATAEAGDNPLAILVQTGREVQEQYLRSLRELFERLPPHGAA